MDMHPGMGAGINEFILHRVPQVDLIKFCQRVILWDIEHCFEAGDGQITEIIAWILKRANDKIALIVLQRLKRFRRMPLKNRDMDVLISGIWRNLVTNSGIFPA